METPTQSLPQTIQQHTANYKVDVVIDGKTVKGIPAGTNNEIIVSATGKLKTSGTVKVDGVRYKIHSEYWTLERLDD